MGLSSFFCSGLTAENEHLTTARVIEKMTSGTYRPSPHTNTLHAETQIILIICHLQIRAPSPRCHQPTVASESTRKRQEMYKRHQLKGENFSPELCRIKCRDAMFVGPSCVEQSCRMCVKAWLGVLHHPSSVTSEKTKSNVTSASVSFTLLTAPPACHLSTLTSDES